MILLSTQLFLIREIIIKIKFRLKRNIIIGTDSTDLYEWEYSKNKGNAQNIIYNDFIKIINSFGDYIVLYEKNTTATKNLLKIQTLLSFLRMEESINQYTFNYDIPSYEGMTKIN